MKKAIVAILAFLGFFALMGMFGLFGLVFLASLSRERMPSRVVLEMDFEQGVIEAVPDDPLGQLMQSRRDVLRQRPVRRDSICADSR